MDRNRPLWPWIVAALVMLAAYPLSYGPWLWAGGRLPKPIRSAGDVLFIPPMKLAMRGPGILAKPYVLYLGWWSPKSAWLFQQVREFGI